MLYGCINNLFNNFRSKLSLKRKKMSTSVATPCGGFTFKPHMDVNVLEDLKVCCYKY